MSSMTRTFALGIALLLPLFLGALWLNTGTLAPYAASHVTTVQVTDCDYLANIDHFQYAATFSFLKGDPASEWNSSLVLRRLLFPILAYPFMLEYGFYYGGIVASFLIQCAAFLGFSYWLLRRFGMRAALAGAALLATYPGTFYWAGLPYSYVMLVPCSLVGLMLLWELYHTRTRRSEWLYSLGLGVLCLGYDLLPYFGFSAFVLLVLKRRIPIPQLLLMSLPSAGVLAIYYFGFGVRPDNANSNVYSAIVKSYLNPDFAAWGEKLTELPSIFLHNFLYSNFIFLPVLFLAAWAIGRTVLKVKLAWPEVALLLAVFSVFLFCNAAPPYENRWQMRGEWIARIYQPVFAAYVLYLARLAGEMDWGNPRGRSGKIGVVLLFGIAVLGNAVISFGSPFPLRITRHAYYHFYQHSVPEALSVNIAKYGARPIGVCSQKDSRPGRRKGKRRKKAGKQPQP